MRGRWPDRAPAEPERAADRAVVVIQRGTTAATREVELGEPVLVAVERRDPAADEKLEVALVDVVDPRLSGLIHEARDDRVSIFLRCASGRRDEDEREKARKGGFQGPDRS